MTPESPGSDSEPPEDASGKLESDSESPEEREQRHQREEIAANDRRSERDQLRSEEGPSEDEEEERAIYEKNLNRAVLAVCETIGHIGAADGIRKELDALDERERRTAIFEGGGKKVMVKKAGDFGFDVEEIQE